LKPLQGLQKRHHDSVQTFAGIAKMPPRFSSDFYRDCKNATAIQFRLLQGLQKRAKIQGRVLQGMQ
jgi:hypothetical protein